MAIRKLLLLGDERLYIKSEELSSSKMDKVQSISDDLSDTLFNLKQKHGYARAITAPELGEPYRMIYLKTSGMELTFINPVITFPDEELFEVWDTCLTFPNLYVKLNRYKNCKVAYKDLDFNDCEISFTLDLSELFQHQYDHLEGILSTQRAIDNKSFCMK